MKFDLKIKTEDLFQSILNDQDAGTFELAIGQMIKGDRGYSAYELAVQKGFEGTTAEWLQSLVQPAEDAQADANAFIQEFTNREILLSESEYELLVQNDAVDLTKKYLIYEDDN